MINFFRKIRQQLLTDNKISKYLLYALGEIVLVVIGILIALQINNWNENQKAVADQRKLFANLKVDFESRLVELSELNASRGSCIEAVLQLNRYISQGIKEENKAEIDSLLSKTINGLKFNEEFRMLEVVFNTGLINDIENESLKRELIQWPQKVEEMLEEQRMHNQVIDEKWLYHLSDYVSLRSIYEHFNFREYGIPPGEPVTLKIDYQGLLEDPRTENHLVLMQQIMRVNKIDTDTLIASATEIISLLELEVEP
jgi:hypothetical protein